MNTREARAHVHVASVPLPAKEIEGTRAQPQNKPAFEIMIVKRVCHSDKLELYRKVAVDSRNAI